MTRKTPLDFACEWYDADSIHHAINRQFEPVQVPRDVYSREFAVWLCEQYRLAMAKGIQSGMESKHGTT